MNRQGWDRTGELFSALVDLTPDDRERRLKEIRDEDPDVGRELDELLASRAEAPGFLADALCDLPSLLSEDGELLDEHPDRIGPYRIREVLGAGGMGVVYDAVRDDEAYERRVAIKVVRRQGLGDAAAVERFQRERQILARLEHPHIARLYDGGTTPEGQAYLVMERIEGLPLTEDLDRRRAAVPERIRSFLKVCSGVAFAHRNLLVHCDLKPANLLVADDGEPRLLDFGIARLLREDEAEERASGERLMTPAYASPEQLRGRDLTTASDVFSLGVVLYELLTGTQPFEGADREGPVRPPSRAVAAASSAEAARIAAERGTTPKGLRRRLAGDLDAVVLKAIAAAPEDRYASVADLAADLERSLDHWPVQARPSSWTYRSLRFLRRRWVGASLAAALVLVLTGVSLMSVLHARRLSVEYAKSELISDFLIDLFATSRPLAEDGVGLSPDQLAQLAYLRISPKIEEDPDVAARLLDTMGVIYHHMGRYPEAAGLISHGLELRTGLFGRDHLETADSAHNLASTQAALGDAAQAEELFRQALAVRERGRGSETLETADTLVALARVRWSRGDATEAETLLRRAVDIQRGHSVGPNRWIAEGLTDLAVVLQQGQGRFDEAEDLLLEAVQIQRRLDVAFPPIVARGLERLAGLRYDRGAFQSAEPLYREAVRLNQSFLGPNHPTTAGSRAQLARCLGAKGSYDEAEELFRQSERTLLAVYAANHPELSTLRNNLAAVLTDAGRLDEAEALYREVYRARIASLGPDHPYVAQSLYSLGRVLHEGQSYDEAEALYGQALTAIESTLGPDHPAASYARIALGRLALETDRPRLAHDQLRAAAAHLASTLPATHWRVAEADAYLALSELALSRADDGDDQNPPIDRSLLRDRLEDARAQLVAERGENDPRARWIGERVGELGSSGP